MLDGEENQSHALITRTFCTLSSCQREHLGQRSSKLNGYPRPESWLMTKLTVEPSLVFVCFVLFLPCHASLYMESCSTWLHLLPKLCKTDPDNKISILKRPDSGLATHCFWPLEHGSLQFLGILCNNSGHPVKMTCCRLESRVLTIKGHCLHVCSFLFPTYCPSHSPREPTVAFPKSP